METVVPVSWARRLGACGVPRTEGSHDVSISTGHAATRTTTGKAMTAAPHRARPSVEHPHCHLDPYGTGPVMITIIILHKGA